MIKYFHPLLLALLLPLSMQAQNFSYKCKIDPVAKDGFYKIQLDPAIAAYSGVYLNDLRLFDNTGKEIPYLYKKEQPYQLDIDYYSYPILDNSSNDEWQTLIIENASKTQIDRFILEMKNAETDRVVRISGSNDKEQWFVVRDKFYFTMLGYGHDATVQTLMTFPTSDYAYFKIEIKNKNKQPLNVLQAGYSKDVSKAPMYNQVKGLTYRRIDSSNKKTYLHFTIAPANRIDKIIFHISAPSLFNRSAILRINEQAVINEGEHTLKSKKVVQVYTQEKLFTLNSELEKAVATDDLMGIQKLNKFSIEIDNNDNEALAIDSITTWQLSETLIAELRQDKTYFLYFGDSLLNAPLYDLRYFEKKIPADIRPLNTADVQAKNTPVNDEYNQSKDKMMVWIGIGVIGLILVFMTVSMMKKMGRESEGE